MKEEKSGPEAPLPEAGRDTSKEVKLRRLLDVMKALMEEKFTGYVKVNFSQGGIGRVEKFEEILK
jgi:hypothetical protein